MQLKEMTDNNVLKGGKPLAELKEETNSLIDKYLRISVSKAKSEAIAYLLKNAEISIHKDDIFVSQINDGSVMWDFWSKRTRKITDLEISDKVKELEESNTIRAGMDFGHIAPDWQYILDRGISGIIKDLEFYGEKNREKAAYYNERIIVYNAIKDLFVRFAELSDSQNTEKSKFISENLRHLAENPPETLAEAMQLILLIFVMQTGIDTVTVRSLGGLDRMLYPFYKNDLESGRYTKEQLSEITKYFFWKIFCMKVTANLPFYICGMDENGNDTTNELTCFLLERYRELDIYDPKIHVMYHKNIDKSVIRLVLEMIREGKNSFVFMNTKVASKALENIGIAPDDAKKVIPYGCYETAAEGTEIPCTCGGLINLVKSIETSINSGKEFTTFDEFYHNVLKELEDYTIECMNAMSRYEPHYNDIGPSMIMSPTYKNSRESGIDVYSGGAKYNNTSIVGAGLATLVDSLVAVKKVVFEDKLKTFDELRNVLLSNWQQDENLRLLIKRKHSKFGNNTTEADNLAKDIYNRFAALINGRKNGLGGVFRCGMFSVDWRFWMGEKTGATPDGRYSGEPLSKNLAASIGQDKNGVTAYLNTLLKFNAENCPDGYVADVVLHCSAVRDEDGMNAFESLLTTFMEKGGFSVHFNVLNPETLLKAQKEPEKYQNLQIRLCGWNVRFVDLDKKQQDEFIKQSKNVM
jgi:formate C-acetyltransferase